MKTTKVLVIIILLFAVGCKKAVSKAEREHIKDTVKFQKQEIASKNQNMVDGFIKESVVVSCGTGCAISYSPTSIKKADNNSLKVIFDVNMYQDEEITDTYEETYVFSYNDSGKLEKVQSEGESENILETLPPGAQQSFMDFGNNLMVNKKI